MPWTFEDLRNSKVRKPSAKRSQQDAANIRQAWNNRWRKNWKTATAEELEADGVDFGIEMDRSGD